MIIYAIVWGSSGACFIKDLQFTVAFYNYNLQVYVHKARALANCGLENASAGLAFCKCNPQVRKWRSILQV